MNPDQFRQLPSVDALLQEATLCDYVHRCGRAIVVDASRDALDAARQTILAGADAPMPARLIDDIRERIERAIRPSLVQTINATGVIIHTNLGRAPLSEETLAAMQAAAQGYSNLEYNLESGERGSRHVHAEALVTHLTGAEAAVVVNNNAAAVMLILAAFARDRQVIISRGQLVEIGGGFRIPDVMEESGAALIEVGTTNRTYLQDYAYAINDQTSLLMRVHSSNFKMVGFIHQPTLAELAALAHEKGILCVDDLGSGTLLDTTPYGLAHEPMPQESLAAGADLVSFSGDKLFGGPQAGVIIGQMKSIDVLKKHPLTRALRVDKVAYAGLQATLLHYLKNEAPKRVPIWTMIAATRNDLDERAQKWVTRLQAAKLNAKVIDAESTVGGGSLPGETLPTRAVALAVQAPDEFAKRLRENSPPIVARIEAGCLIFDPRTVLPKEEELLLAGIERVSRLME
jgi:L-seryl-tRNA(Ser) seleniumtransferase